MIRRAPAERPVSIRSLAEFPQLPIRATRPEMRRIITGCSTICACRRGSSARRRCSIRSFSRRRARISWPFLPPFNSVSNYRDPGLVNINTMTAQEVWNALMNNGGSGPTYQQLAGQPPMEIERTTGQLLTTNPVLPTSFAGAYSARRPRPTLCLWPSMMRSGVDATLLRPEQTGGNTPLFGSELAIRRITTTTAPQSVLRLSAGRADLEQRHDAVECVCRLADDRVFRGAALAAARD